MDRHRLEVARHDACVIGSQLESDPRTGIRGQRLPGGLVQLRKMLVGKCQVEAVGSRLRQYVVDRLRQVQVVVELIEVEVEVRAPYFRAPRAGRRRLPDPRHDKGAQQAARLFTQLALGEVDQQNSLPVNHFMQVNGRSA